MNRQTTEEEKISASQIINKNLLFRMDKEFLQMDKKSKIQRKWTKDLKWHFTKEEIQMTGKHDKLLRLFRNQGNKIPLHTYHFG